MTETTSATKTGAYLLRLSIAMPMVIVGSWLEDGGAWLCRKALRVEGEDPRTSDVP